MRSEELSGVECIDNIFPFSDIECELGTEQETPLVCLGNVVEPPHTEDPIEEVEFQDLRIPP
ncbi:Hypothetical predicted protein, partial [Pelobates cultripes]